MVTLDSNINVYVKQIDGSVYLLEQPGFNPVVTASGLDGIIARKTFLSDRFQMLAWQKRISGFYLADVVDSAIEEARKRESFEIVIEGFSSHVAFFDDSDVFNYPLKSVPIVIKAAKYFDDKLSKAIMNHIFAKKD